MAQPRKAIRLVHAPKGFCEVMIHANTALSNGELGEAINHYNEVLYKLAPAHVCALLNRSMAFLKSGYHELAVVDAFRACVAASELRQNTPAARDRLRRVAKYIRAEQLHIRANDRWTKPECDGETGWTSSPLASVVINATPEAAVPGFETSGPALSTALEIRANYRVCGALFMVGDGARSDALSLIDDARSRLHMSAWESDWFHKLGNEIMIQLTDEVDPIDPEELKLLGHDTREKRDERMTKLKENMKATTARIDYGDYSWNPYKPDLEDPTCQEQIQAWVQNCSGNCSAFIIEPEETDGTWAEGSEPYVELRANQDIRFGDLVLSEQTISNVTTSIPEQIEAKRRAGAFGPYYCNSCASLLLVPSQCPNRFQFQAPETSVQSEIAPASPTLSALNLGLEDFNSTTQGNLSTGVGITAHSGHSLITPGAPSSLARSSPPRDFMFCRPNHMVPTCSATCREMSEGFDNRICETKIEQDLRQSHLNGLKPRSMTDRKYQCLRDLILLRYLTVAINLDDNPLRFTDLMFATCGPNTTRSPETRRLEPWSFFSHVVRPIRYLQQLFHKSNTDQFLKLSNVDGWIINTLIANINAGISISHGPRYAKCFNADGMLDKACGPRDDCWDALTGHEDHEDRAVWIASVDPLLNMIRIADPAKGEKSNVAVVRREGVNVYAAAEQGIRAGETLLRAGEGTEGSVAGVGGEAGGMFDGGEMRWGDKSEGTEEEEGSANEGGVPIHGDGSRSRGSRAS